jgi:hypothetical protein
MDYLLTQLAVQHGVFTLGCRKLTEKLPHLTATLIADTRLSVKECCRDFDAALTDFKRCVEPKRADAVRRFVQGWRGRTQYYENTNSSAWSVLEEVAEKTIQAAENWDYRADIEDWHQIGRSLAHQYFATTPYSEVRGKLTNCARIVHPYDGLGNDSDKPDQNPFGKGPSPIAYRKTYQDPSAKENLENIILVRCLSDKNIALYLGYPFMFLHEYTAHIFVNDYQNDIFNDGWMLFAAASFLQRQAIEKYRAGRSFPLNPAQVSIFGNEFLPQMKANVTNNIPAKGYAIASQISELLRGENLHLTFENITQELSAFVPRADEPKQWPTRFLNKLGESLEIDPEQLLTKIRLAEDVRDLYARLA